MTTASDSIEVLLQRDCHGGQQIVELRLPRPVTLEDLGAVEGVQTRVLLSDLPRPFYKLDAPGRYLVTGILGDPRVRVTVRLARRAEAVPIALTVAKAMLAAAGPLP